MKLENLRKMEVCSELMLPYILTGIICLLVGILLIGIPVGIQVRKQTAEKEITSAEEEAKRIINESIKSA